MSICMSCGTTHECSDVKRLLADWRKDKAALTAAQERERVMRKALDAVLRAKDPNRISNDPAILAGWKVLGLSASPSAEPCRQCHGNGFIDEDEGLTVECLKCAPPKEAA